MSPRDNLLSYAEQHLGCPYIWAAKGQRVADGRRAFDCSGFVSCCVTELFPFLKARFPPPMTNARSFHAQLPETSVPDAGPEAVVLAFFGKTRVWHVELVYPDGRCIGSSGGDAECTTVEVADSLHACVKTKPRYNYRKDFRSLGVLRLTP